MKRIAFLFPGQGAQSVGMGKDFYEQFEKAREIFQEADELLQRSLSKVIFEGPDNLLTETRNSQTGIYVMSLALLRVLENQFPGLVPIATAGLSLGEYTALTASGKIAFSSCLPLVQFRAEAMNEACLATKGKMAAIFGLSSTEVEEMVKEVNLPSDLWAANFNCPGQTVISGTERGIEEGIRAAKERGAKRVIPLNVHGAFHSGLMKEAEKKLAPRLEALVLEKTPISLVMNVNGHFAEGNEEIKKNLMKQVTSAVRWEQGIRAMAPKVDLFIEIGCGKTLAGMNRQIDPSLVTISINKVEDMEKLAEVME